MRVTLVCGPCPPGACGVGDYTGCLANALNAIAIETDVLSCGNWRLYNSFSVYRTLLRLNPDIVHIQYPSLGFGTNLGPQAFALLHSCVVTLHEASQAHILRKLALFPFSIRSKHLIFPSECERDFAMRWAPWVSPVSSVIGVPSNIKRAVLQPARMVNEIVYFGLIMPHKGLEEVMRLGELIKVSGLPLRIRIMGTVPARHTWYFEALRSKSSQLPIVWENGLGEEEVAGRLAASAVAYLPYPDGASERRASLKAALINGVAVVTTRGSQTPSDLEGAVSFVHTAEEALVAVSILLKSSEERSRLTGKGIQYASQYTWERIAERHAAVYDRVLVRRGGREVLPFQNASRGASSSL